MPTLVASQPVRLVMVTSGTASLFLEASNKVLQGAGEQLQHEATEGTRKWCDPYFQLTLSLRK